MRVIDAHSGRDVRVGQRINFGQGGHWIELVAFKPRMFTADVTFKGSDVEGEATARLPVRYMHPAYPFQRVVILPS